VLAWAKGTSREIDCEVVGGRGGKITVTYQGRVTKITRSKGIDPNHRMRRETTKLGGSTLVSCVGREQDGFS
jgi:hypothetical protein